ncbi:MAG: hypothetical protein EXR47_03625 [Dehalococcoidia bacterium]|nr:hypothetical protein [Dehalococcoidia bacterium]
MAVARESRLPLRESDPLHLENGLIALQNGEAGKAGELLWGSVAEAVHALAVTKNVPIQSHWQLHNFVLKITEELKDESLAQDLYLAESLHHNYFEVQLEPRDIEVLLPKIRELVRKLLEFIPPQAISS